MSFMSSVKQEHGYPRKPVTTQKRIAKLEDDIRALKKQVEILTAQLGKWGAES